MNVETMSQNQNEIEKRKNTKEIHFSCVSNKYFSHLNMKKKKWHLHLLFMM